MMYRHYLTAALSLVFASHTSAQAVNPGVVSQFLGTTSVDPASVITDTDSVSATISSVSLSVCTHYLNVQLGTANLVPSAASELFSVQVSAVCELCTNLSQTRVDSCCAQSTASACFAAFGDDNSGSGHVVTASTASGPARNSATATPLTAATGSAAMTGTGTGMGSSATASASGNSAAGLAVANKGILAQSILITLLGVVGFAL